MKLRSRLQKMAAEITKGETMADIGTDHGFLPIYLYKTGICPKVILTDISSGSLEKAAENCRLLEPDADFDCRLGNGISILNKGEVDDIAIAGMGGALIAEIMGDDPELSHSFKKFILQPRNNIGLLRQWLYENGYAVTREQLAREGRFICVVMTAEFAPEAAVMQTDFEYPDSLLEHRNELTVEYLQREREKHAAIVRRIEKNSSNAAEEGKLAKKHIETIDRLLKEMNFCEKEQVCRDN